MATTYDVNETSEANCLERLITSIGEKASSFGSFLYKDGKVMGRNASSWGKIGFFYLIYYLCLGGFFATTLAVFYKTTEWEYPKLQGTNSLIKNNPGMGFRPVPGISTTLISFIAGNQSSYKVHTDVLKAYLSYFDKSNQTGENFITCSNVDSIRPQHTWHKSCVFDIADFGENIPCTEANGYGYKTGSPCILLKLNKVYGWLPEPYVNGTDEMPSQVKSPYHSNSVTVACEGEHQADKDNIGRVSFYPPGGFSFKYYPYINQRGYRQPLVFAHFENITNGLVVMVRCKAFAKNIRHNKREQAGSIHFELLVD